MKRLCTAFCVGAAVIVAITWPALIDSVTAQTGASARMPAEIESYRSWTRMNASPLVDPSNPRLGAKNTFINLSPDQLRGVIGPGGRVRRPFPDGTIAVRESLDADAGFVRILFAQRRDSARAETKGWVFTGFSRSGAGEAYQALDIPDPVTRCLNCHEQVRDSDRVFTPFLNRPDAPPARPRPGIADRIEIFNYAFSPSELRVKAGATVTVVNYDAVVHDVKASNLSFESGNLPTQGRHFETFTRPGIFEYFCALHLEMRGRIVVEP